MMRLLKPLAIVDSAQVMRICAQWLRDELGLAIVEYRIGNSFTGSIDILATDDKRVFLVTINTGRLGDALLGALTGYRWFLENRDFLARVYHSDTVNLLLEPVLVILSGDFPPEIHSIFRHGLRIDFRLFKYVVFGSEDDPDLYVEEVILPAAAPEAISRDLAALRHELGIERSDLTDQEIIEFQRAMGED